MTFTVYADSTGLFTEEQCNRSNICNIEIPKKIVREFYYRNKTACNNDCIEYGFPETFEGWLLSYTADVSDDLLKYARTRYKYVPVLAT